MSRKKEIIIFILIFLFLSLAGMIVFDIKNEAEQTSDYSTYSDREKGGRVLFQLAREMGYDVGRHESSSRFLPDDATVVAFSPERNIVNSGLEKKYLLSWIERGNSFVLIDSAESVVGEKYEILDEATSYTKVFSYFGENRMYNIGEGQFIYLKDYEKYTNEEIKDLDPGVVFIHALKAASNERVLFNEFYHGFGKEATLLDIIGFSGRLILIQLALAFLIYIYIKSKRFGKPVVVHETIKREENENMFALSNIYMKANANSMVLEIVYEKFKTELANFLGYRYKEIDYNEVLSKAENNVLLKDMNIKELVRDCEGYIKNDIKDRKTMERLFTKLEKIRRVIKE
ncbi:DUF4350 domain-containing protein [Herbivorax sp. ANBcel31]|uniref:DUF4350 domain-containing protein n=1 Tax=Herbivorax sp. ANBcel31 TaxID=3069754 RepID=UPI0027B21CCF|nr:DUF4350 domain-containing protein [Herbivorax sp. ANBcel31]MDQ2086203.1 DUF4350 domain-containing protein [Herbivorax sp. ANBcel31]